MSREFETKFHEEVVEFAVLLGRMFIEKDRELTANERYALKKLRELIEKMEGIVESNEEFKKMKQQWNVEESQ